ncbi:MAG: hypothetical protein E6943_06370 [Actinomyces sp.]|nr:hypothetical protein [Actinomyces sp.]
MKISLTARLKTADEFFGQFTDGDEREAFDGQALIFSALANTKIPDRYDIADFLLERDCALTPAGSEANSPLHVLLSSRKHDLHRDLKLARIFLDRGVDINHRNANNEVAFAWLVDLPFTDDELADLYDLWFSSPHLLDFTASSSHYRACPLDALARIEYRATLVSRCIREQPSADDDSGWLFIHEGDDARQPKNVATEIVPLSTIVASTPVVMSVLALPSGTDVRIVKGSVGTTIVETTTDRLVPGTWPFDYETSEGASS